MTVEINEKKQEFLEVSLDLFYEKGYEKTTINDIIGRLGVSKGAFYHYFKSKEEVLETIADEYTENILKQVKIACERNDICPLEKFNNAIEVVQRQKKLQSEKREKMKGILLDKDNLKLKKKISDKIGEKFTPYYKKIIYEAIDQGIFEVKKSDELVFFFLNTVQIISSEIERLELKNYTEEFGLNRDNFKRELDEKLDFYEGLLQRIFNIKKGRIKLKSIISERY